MDCTIVFPGGAWGGDGNDGMPDGGSFGILPAKEDLIEAVGGAVKPVIDHVSDASRALRKRKPAAMGNKESGLKAVRVNLAQDLARLNIS
jgi:hypothetical protein